MVLDLRKLEVKESKLQVSPQPLNKWIRTTANNFVHESEARNDPHRLSARRTDWNHQFQCKQMRNNT